ncbi:aromatic acid/H+ symport family MFS transporter [Pelomonas sp. KK5]|uniref:MFS transporter n=1 Tax=Pelomonas sp. KK5 TaxID=1855730 RepID=UPI00097C2015|nr:aromatic acid/H+ symport family MFS transporter [Pelomonas sp. KK5]
MGGRQWLLLALCFAIVALDGMDVAIMGFLAPSILQEWSVSRAAFGIVMSAAPFGLVLGALLAGPASDRIGRKAVLTGSVLLFGLFTVATAYAANLTQMATLRLLTGVGLGAAMPNSTTLLSEYVPQRSRSLLIAVMFTGFNLGSGVVGFIAAAMIPAQGWRSVLMLGGVLPLVLVPVLIALLPESARFLVVRRAAADRIARVLGRISGTVFAPGTEFFAPEPPVQARKPIGVLFSKGYGLMTGALWVTYFMGLLVIYLLTGWLPTLIKDAGLPISQAATITAMFQIGGTVGAILVGWAMDRRAPTRVIGAAYALGAACILALGLGGALSGSLTLLVAAAGFFMSGAQTGLNAFAPNCYPTRARATGVSWMLGMGRFGSITGSMVGGVLLALGWGFGSIISLLAVPAVLAGLAVQKARRVEEAEELPSTGHAAAASASH